MAEWSEQHKRLLSLEEPTYWKMPVLSEPYYSWLVEFQVTLSVMAKTALAPIFLWLALGKLRAWKFALRSILVLSLLTSRLLNLHTRVLNQTRAS